MIANHRVLHQRTHPFLEKDTFELFELLKQKECPLSEKCLRRILPDTEKKIT